ncbi:MAG: ATP--guanido phosphotransferase, partial [Gemmatimonadota bacterium]|nr:ATP--guanido phosphotransferase [Gemmatimonadota bacterium]
MIDLNLLPDGGMPWLDASGPNSQMVLSTRIRLARNLANRPFAIRATGADRERVLSEVVAVSRECPSLEAAQLIRLDRIGPGDRRLLHERHLVSRELACLEGEAQVRPASAVLLRDRIGLMLNEEDHLRLQGIRSGFDLQAAYQDVERMDSELGQRLAFAFHSEFGYLTSCPTNAGTGMRASVLIHLPGLVLTKEISKVLQGLAQVGLTFRGLYGEGSEVVGNFFQLSNQTTLGKSEQELLDHLGRMVRQVIEYEEQARHVLRRDVPIIIEDKVWRAYGLLRHARSLSFEEAMNLLSGVRLGVGLGL